MVLRAGLHRISIIFILSMNLQTNCYPAHNNLHSPQKCMRTFPSPLLVPCWDKAILTHVSDHCGFDLNFANKKSIFSSNLGGPKYLSIPLLFLSVVSIVFRWRPFTYSKVFYSFRYGFLNGTVSVSSLPVGFCREKCNFFFFYISLLFLKAFTRALGLSI